MIQLAAPLAAQIGPALGDWQPLLERWAASEAGRATLAAVDARVAAGAAVYPPQVFRAFELTPMAETRVVILGQDPYHTPRRAEGLAFSVQAGIPTPPSLRNIFKELQRDLGLPLPQHGHLAAWARQGVLLLNTCLTVEMGRPASHTKRGWEALTDEIIKSLSEGEAPKAFMLWGAHAQSKAVWPQAQERHAVLMANHPSPLSARRGPVPFLGCGHFSAANRFLAATGQTPIDWSLG
jgi:uracil-DNA glycosylase